MKKWIIIAFLIVTAPLLAEIKIIAFAGSTREDSYNKKLVRQAAEYAHQKGAKITVIDLRDYPMPLYDADEEKNRGMPQKVRQFRNLLIESNALLIASPEYNGAVSAVLKNAIDWASRNEEGNSSREAFKGKIAAIMSASPGQSGGKRGLVNLRNILEDLGACVIKKQVSIPNAQEAFDASGKLNNPSLKQELQEEMQQLLQN